MDWIRSNSPPTRGTTAYTASCRTHGAKNSSFFDMIGPPTNEESQHRSNRMSKEARASNPEKDSTAAKSYETRQLEPVHGGIVAAAHQRRMYSPHVIGAGA